MQRVGTSAIGDRNDMLSSSKPWMRIWTENKHKKRTWFFTTEMTVILIRQKEGRQFSACCQITGLTFMSEIFWTTWLHVSAVLDQRPVATSHSASLAPY